MGGGVLAEAAAPVGGEEPVPGHALLHDLGGEVAGEQAVPVAGGVGDQAAGEAVAAHVAGTAHGYAADAAFPEFALDRGGKSRSPVSAAVVARRVHAYEQVAAGERFAEQARRYGAAEQVVFHQRRNVVIRALRPHGAVAHHLREHQHVVAACRGVAGGGGHLDAVEALAVAGNRRLQGAGQAIRLIEVRRPVRRRGEHHHVAPVELDGAGQLLAAGLQVTHRGK